MEILWKWLSLCLGLLLVGLCNGFPINLEDTSAEHTQLLTGLVAVLLTVCSIVVLVGCVCCQRRNGFKEFRDSPVVASVASNLDHGQINPIANGEFTIFTPLSPPLYNNNVFLANEQVITRTSDDYVYGDIDVSFWFDPSKKDFPRIKLKYIKELGKGWFGKVVEGAAQDLDTGKTWTPVVVRILDAASDARQRVLFLNDASMYLAPEHPSLLSLKGRCVGAAPLLLLQESCPLGDLKARLRNVGAEDKALQWCCEVTSALRHLHDHGLVHHDLAARNCLLTDNLTLKIGDYGLGPSKYPEDYYKGGEPLVPVRWRSPESLECTPTTIQPRKMTPDANVWSLGVVLWEICENGAQPYGDLDDDDVISRVFGVEQLRLGKPSKSEMYTDYIYRLIQLCWSNIETRPKIAQIDIMLSDLLQVYRNTKNQIPNATNDFDQRWESLKPNTIVKTDNYTVSIIMEPHDAVISKPMSPSLNNLHGSLDNLVSAQPMESWLQDIGDASYVKGVSEAIKTLDTALELENISTSSDHSAKPNVDFKLGPSIFSANEKTPDSPNQNDSLTDSMIFKQPGSSESETEEENWKKKVERGAYTEKVKLKSRSVADLMVLTHVDYSESESETPLPSLDYRANKSGKKSNLESAGLSFSSEGNLLSVENTFEEELRKLQLERRDSLLFVPDSSSRNNSNLSLLHELNSPSEIKPVNQVFNVYNVTIDKFGPLNTSGSKLAEIIGIGDDSRSFSRQDSENKSDLGYATLHNSERNSDFGSVDGEQLLDDRIGCIKNEIEERLRNCEPAKMPEEPTDTEDKQRHPNDFIDVSVGQKQNLPDIIASLDQEQNQNSFDLIESNSLQFNECIYVDEIRDVCQQFIEEERNENQNNLPQPDDLVQNEESREGASSDRQSALVLVPKLSDIIRNNKDLMSVLTSPDKQGKQIGAVQDCEITLKESQNVPDFCSETVENVKSSHSVNTNDIEDFFIMKISSAPDISRKTSVGSNSSASSREQVFSESFVPELKQSFVEGPKIERLTPPPPTKILSDSGTYKDLDSVFRVEEEADENDSASECSEDFSANSISGDVTSDTTEKEVDEDNYLSTDDESGIPKELDYIESNRSSPVEDISENLYRMDTDSDSKKDTNLQVASFLNEERKQASLSYTEVGSKNTPLTREENTEPEPSSIDSLLNSNNALDSNEEQDSNPIQVIVETTDKTPESLNVTEAKPRVAFDISKDQDEMIPNTLTHHTLCTSTPFRKKQEISFNTESPYSSLNLFDAPQEVKGQEGTMEFSSNFVPLESQPINPQAKLNYSLETWDNFLGKSFDSNRASNENLFDSFSSEPQSMLFIEDGNQKIAEERGETQNNTYVMEARGDATFNKNGTFVKEERNDGTFVKDERNDGTFVKEERKDGTFVLEHDDNSESPEDKGNSRWESGGGWFLHPQSNNDKLSGNIEPQPSTSKGSYVGFGRDDEIMAAIRNELLEKLPHAQGASHEAVKEEDELDQTERNEVFLRYNVYNTPLSPIPEESFEEDDDDDQPTTENTNTQKLDDTDSDWSDQGEPDGPAILSSQTNESPLRVPNHRHTPSQDSCCSNDTLFNLEDFACANDKETPLPEPDPDDNLYDLDHVAFFADDVKEVTESSANETYVAREQTANLEEESKTEPVLLVESPEASQISRPDILECSRDSTGDFLDSERNHTSSVDVRLCFIQKQVAPLPSPEDKPWKSLPASLLSFDKYTQNSLIPEHVESTSESTEDSKVTNENLNLNECVNDEVINDNETATNAVVENESPSDQDLDTNVHDEKQGSNSDDTGVYINIPSSSSLIPVETPVYENVIDPSDIINEADYVNAINMENKKHNEVLMDEKEEQIYENSIPQKENINMETDHDILGVLTDIRFNGPLDNQLMSTSFSESNEPDEQDWDSGSDTRSSSSGEFIWKLEDIKPMEEIVEELTDSDVSTSSDEDGETPEFVPSAWDKYATPTKSALRSPEKSLERSEHKSKGVWFKKQKYHCVYEYPREPESPVLQSQDLWKAQTDFSPFTEWEFDAETYLPPPTADSDLNPSTFTFKPKINNSRCSLYFLTSVDDQGAGSSTGGNTEDDFMISSSSSPFEINPLCSQFFPGNTNWVENATPDSGLEDSTPGSVSDASEFSGSYPTRIRQVLSLQQLAGDVVKRSKQDENKASKDALGGLRHTRNKLKLDLPPSPSAFTSNRTFTIEPAPEPFVLREKPTFSTFGKSRFLVQQVDTPTENNIKKNVCFEVLPYKPPSFSIPDQIEPNVKQDVIYEPLKENFEEIGRFHDKKEVFSKGEANLLDSADEDSGIESSTLERKVTEHIELK
ncbi:uncharacterized protein LOC143198196 isoform X4 [Rhynchophorus ferrugineus]|uniref:uncharacterized protein LOC143198196 isoform X4 n=1 Tax=Rhynchophorus ferrugineus TaxID=354439 RepID=UPI003FCD338C